MGNSNKEWWADDRRDGYCRFYGANLWIVTFGASFAVFSEVEGRVLAGGLSSLRMEALSTVSGGGVEGILARFIHKRLYI